MSTKTPPRVLWASPLRPTGYAEVDAAGQLRTLPPSTRTGRGGAKVSRLPFPVVAVAVSATWVVGSVVAVVYPATPPPVLWGLAGAGPVVVAGIVAAVRVQAGREARRRQSP